MGQVRQKKSDEAAKQTRRRRVTPPAAFASRAADRKIASLASRQHGLVTRPQAIACGMSPTAVKRRLRRGRWEKLYRGVYAIAGSPRSREREILAACLAAGPDAVATSYSAAELYRLPKISSNGHPIIAAPPTNKVRCPKRKLDAIEKAERARRKPRPKRARAPFTLRHRSYLMRPGARTEHADVPVTSVAWTYVELAEVIPEQRLELSITEAIRRKLVTAEELAEAVVAAGDRAHVTKLRRILAGPVVREAYRSLGEIILRQQLRDDGYSDAVMNKPFTEAGEYIGSPDASSERAKLIVEVDGPSHASEAQQSIDRIQTELYEALGWAVARVKPAELASRAKVRARIAAAEKRRRSKPVSRAEFLALFRRLTAGLPPTHIPPRGEFPTAAAQFL